jgi:hypothetical protein
MDMAQDCQYSWAQLIMGRKVFDKVGTIEGCEHYHLHKSIHDPCRLRVHPGFTLLRHAPLLTAPIGDVCTGLLQ